MNEVCDISMIDHDVGIAEGGGPSLFRNTHGITPWVTRISSGFRDSGVAEPEVPSRASVLSARNLLPLTYPASHKGERKIILWNIHYATDTPSWLAPLVFS